MSSRQTRSPLIGAAILGVVLAGVVALASSIGASSVSIATAWSGDEVARQILFQIRLPRVLLAALVGAILASSGATFQALLRNPLADPFILGVSGGAACGAAVSTALGLAGFGGVVPIAAFAGSCIAIVAVILLARTGRAIDGARLLLSGLVLNAFFSAVILLALSLTSGSDLTSALRWMMGAFFTATWADVILLLVVFTTGIAVLFALASDLRMLTFGEEDARSRGVNTERVMFVAFLAASLMTGAAVSVSGIIGFVGLLVPHAVRIVWRRDIRYQLPLTALGGAILLVAADLASRIVIAPGELPVGALTALLGVPFFLAILRRPLH